MTMTDGFRRQQKTWWRGARRSRWNRRKRRSQLSVRGRDRPALAEEVVCRNSALYISWDASWEQILPGVRPLGARLHNLSNACWRYAIYGFSWLRGLLENYRASNRNPKWAWTRNCRPYRSASSTEPWRSPGGGSTRLKKLLRSAQIAPLLQKY